MNIAYPRGDKRRMALTNHYMKNPDGSYTRNTIAFLFAIQHHRNMPHVDHGANSGNRRLGNKPFPPRNYSAWPIWERVKVA